MVDSVTKFKDFMSVTKDKTQDSQSYNFGADITNMMTLIINSIYPTKEIFLRELISNASDASEKRRIDQLITTQQSAPVSQFPINIFVDKENKLLILEDHGIGMDLTDLKDNLGTIARSGTRDFMEKMSQADASHHLIGQFGLGFYSAFLVAEFVEVFSRKINTDEVHCWSSNASGNYTLSKVDVPMEIGTKVVMHLKSDQLEYLEESTLRKIVEKHSLFIAFPLNLLCKKNVSEERSKEDVAVFTEGSNFVKLTDVTPDAFHAVGSLCQIKPDVTLGVSQGEYSFAADSTENGAISMQNTIMKICKDAKFSASFTGHPDIYKFSEDKIEISNESDEYSSVDLTDGVYLSIRDGFVVSYADNKFVFTKSAQYPSLETAPEDMKAVESVSVEKEEFEQLNSMQALWLRDPKDITQEEYNAFYKSITNDWDEPLTQIHFQVTGNVEFTALLFIPKRAPFDLFDNKSKKSNLKLYLKRVVVQDECDTLMPEYLNMVKGIVDSEDLPLNVSREALQKNQIMDLIKSNLTKKVVETLTNMMQNDPENYKTLYEQFAKCIKLGIHEDSQYRKKLTDLLMFTTSKTGTDSKVSLKQYIETMPEEQTSIYFVTGEDVASVEALPHLEALKKRKIEVIYMVEPIDEYVITMVKDYEGKTLVNVTKESTELHNSEEDTKAFEQLCTEYEPVTKVMKEILGSKVEKVVLTAKLFDSAACISTASYGWSANMERIMKTQLFRDNGVSTFMHAKNILEVNPKHPLIATIKAQIDSNAPTDEVKDKVMLLFYTACIISTCQIDDPKLCVKLIQGSMGYTTESESVAEVSDEIEEVERVETLD